MQPEGTHRKFLVFSTFRATLDPWGSPAPRGAIMYTTVIRPVFRQTQSKFRISLCSVMYRGADKSLARPGRKQARKHVRDARDFNNIETRAVIKLFFPVRQGAEGNWRHSDRNISLFPTYVLFNKTCMLWSRRLGNHSDNGVCHNRTARTNSSGTCRPKHAVVGVGVKRRHVQQQFHIKPSYFNVSPWVRVVCQHEQTYTRTVLRLV